MSRERDRGCRIRPAQAQHDLAGEAATQLTLSAALRARDACRPDEADLALAQETLAIVRRNWRPPGS